MKLILIKNLFSLRYFFLITGLLFFSSINYVRSGPKFCLDQTGAYTAELKIDLGDTTLTPVDDLYAGQTKCSDSIDGSIQKIWVKSYNSPTGYKADCPWDNDWDNYTKITYKSIGDVNTAQCKVEAKKP